MKKLEEMTDVELKALAYDIWQHMQNSQNDLNIINQELVRRKNMIKPKESKQ